MASKFLLIIAIITIVINSETSNGARILGVFPLNGKSHFNMCEQLMKALAKKGHQVDVISHFPLKKPFPNYKDLSLEGSLPNAMNNLTYEMVSTFMGFSLKVFVENTGNNVCKLLKHPAINNIIKNPPNDPPYDAVIVEIFAANCYLAFGRHLKVPVIGVSTAVLYDWIGDAVGNPGNQAIVPGIFSNLPQKMNFWQRLQNTLMSHFITYQFHYYAASQKQFVDENFGPGYPSISELSTELSLLFTNTHFSLNGVQPMTPGVVEVGGIHIDDSGENLSPELQKWLDESIHGCVYVSFGSMMKIESMPKKILETFYATFKNIAPVRVLMKIAKKEELPSGLPENVKVNPWLPQVPVLKHQNVKAFVTHGGLMGTLESIYAGVPMVGIPLFGDQNNNIRLYELKKMAVSLDYKNMTEKAFTDAIKTVLKDPEFRSSIERISKIYWDRPKSPQETAVFWTEYVIRNGNVLRSPAIYLAWWQVALLDVYGFIICVTLLVLWIVLMIIKIIMKCIFRSKKVDEKTLLSKKKK